MVVSYQVIDRETDVWLLYQFALCPFSRKVRLLLSENRIAAELVSIAPWESQPVYPRFKHSKLVPVLKDNRGLVLENSTVICEFIEETVPNASMMMGSAEQRAEIRRLVAWADDCFYGPLVLPLLIDAFGTGPQPARPSQSSIDDVSNSADMHLDEIAYLLDHRAWMAGPTISLADLAIAAHLSVLDYFGAIDWTGHDQVQNWYSVMKSRRSFQPLLADRVEGIDPPPHYSAIDN
jgi:glutathione S-transferase